MPFGLRGLGFSNASELVARFLEIIGLNGFAEVKNNFGAVVMLLNHQGFFGYEDLGNATQGQTVLALVFSATAQNDPINGTLFNPGLTSIDPAFGDSLNTLGANISFGQVAYTSEGQVASRTASGGEGPFTKVDAPEQTHAGHLQMLLFGAWTGLFSLPALVAGFTTGSGVINRFTPYNFEIQASDGNVYVPLVANTQSPGQSILNAVTAINGFSGINCNNSPYRVNGVLFCKTNGTAGTVTVSLQNAGVVPTNVDVLIKQYGVTAPATYLDDVLSPSHTSTIASAAIPANTNFKIVLNGELVFGGSGVFGFEALFSVAAGFQIFDGSPLTIEQGLSASTAPGGNPIGYPPVSDILLASDAVNLFAPAGVVQQYQGGQNYAAGAIVVNAGTVYYATNAITNSPVTFNIAQWTVL